MSKRIWNKLGQIKLTGLFVPWDFSSFLRRMIISQLRLARETHSYRPPNTKGTGIPIEKDELEQQFSVSGPQGHLKTFNA